MSGDVFIGVCIVDEIQAGVQSSNIHLFIFVYVIVYI